MPGSDHHLMKESFFIPGNMEEINEFSHFLFLLQRSAHICLVQLIKVKENPEGKLMPGAFSGWGQTFEVQLSSPTFLDASSSLWMLRCWEAAQAAAPLLSASPDLQPRLCLHHLTCSPAPACITWPAVSWWSSRTCRPLFPLMLQCLPVRTRFRWDFPPHSLQGELKDWLEMLSGVSASLALEPRNSSFPAEILMSPVACAHSSDQFQKFLLDNQQNPENSAWKDSGFLPQWDVGNTIGWWKQRELQKSPLPL